MMRWKTLVFVACLPCLAMAGEIESRAVDVDAIAQWMNERYYAEGGGPISARELVPEPRLCNCNDSPRPHYPYVLFFFRTPKVDLVTRLERGEGEQRFVALAVRHGTTYCSVASDAECYGSFEEPCDFSDHRFGAMLRPYFPTCME